MTKGAFIKYQFVAATVFFTTNAVALDAQQIFERVSHSVVVVKAGNSMGSGVVFAVDNSGLTPNTTILTNCHVVQGLTQVTVERLGKKASATVKVCDAERDMAIVTLGGALPTLSVRSTPLKVGEPAFAVGAPQGLELSISQGIVSQLRPTSLGKDPMIQTTAAISQGSSGGGLFDSEGRLIGLTTLYYKEGQSLNFAVPLSFLASLKNTASSRAIATPNPSTSAPPNQQCGWTLVGKSDAGRYERYIDYCLITGTGRYRSAWLLTNNTGQPQRITGSPSVSSTLTKSLYDCQLFRNAITADYWFEGNMGKGDVVTSYLVPENQREFRDQSYKDDVEAVCK